MFFFNMFPLRFPDSTVLLNTLWQLSFIPSIPVPIIFYISLAGALLPLEDGRLVTETLVEVLNQKCVTIVFYQL